VNVLDSRYPITISNARRIDGWMTDLELLWLAYQAYEHKRICEVGSWLGRSSRALGDSTQGHLWCVDTWAGSEEHKERLAGRDPDELFNAFRQNMTGLDTKLSSCRGYSLEVAQHFEQQGITFDLVFLDAAHDYESVKADIKAYAPLVEKGGILSGHDYRINPWEGVIRAVDEAFPQAVNAIDDIWMVKL
jgi:predicted O-methyltransferase YrrM